jgi:hypothetical protein
MEFRGEEDDIYIYIYIYIYIVVASLITLIRRVLFIKVINFRVTNLQCGPTELPSLDLFFKIRA